MRWDLSHSGMCGSILVDQPVQHLGVSVGGVADQLFRIESEAVERTLDHALCRQHLGLTDRGRRFNLDDDRVVDIDQIVGGLSGISCGGWA